jgi:hypothetical protein
MRCKKCGVPVAKFDEQPALLTRLRFHPASFLITSTAFSALLIYAIQQYLDVKGGKAVYSVAIIPTITIVHHLVSARLRRSSAAWPATPLFGERNQIRYFLSLSFLWVFYIFLSPRFIDRMAWGFQAPEHPRVLPRFMLRPPLLRPHRCICLHPQMLNTEVKAKCLQEGHEWMCVRICWPEKEAGQ